MKGQWFGCLLKVHKYDVISKDAVTNFRNEEVGTNYVQQCINCGRIKTKFVSNKIEEITRGY